MKGHIITAGIHEGKNYVCADIQEMLNRTQISNTAKMGIRAAFHTLGIPDVVCSGLTPEQIPTSNQTVGVKK